MRISEVGETVTRSRLTFFVVLYLRELCKLYVWTGSVLVVQCVQSIFSPAIVDYLVNHCGCNGRN